MKPPLLILAVACVQMRLLIMQEKRQVQITLKTGQSKKKSSPRARLTPSNPNPYRIACDSRWALSELLQSK
jgi:hypothetical protein